MNTKVAHIEKAELDLNAPLKKTDGGPLCQVARLATAPTLTPTAPDCL